MTQRWVKIEEFDYCAILQGATFNAFTDIPALGGSIAEGVVSTAQVAKLIDQSAMEAKNRLMDRYGVFFERDVQRYACYAAAEGSNSHLHLTTQPLLHRIDPMSYFSKLIPSLTPSTSPIPGERRRYNLAYLLMIHKASIWEQSQQLMEVLDDGSAVFLVHIDPLATELAGKVQEWIHERDARRFATGEAPRALGNVFIAQTSYEGMWGHASLVWMQLSGFWELLDLADWDFVINLSGHDWPLRTSAEIYRTLNSTKHRGKEHIEFWTEPSDMANRLTRPHLGRSDRPSVEWSLVHPREVGLRFPPFLNWNWCKQHQWMMLTYDFVTDLRTNLDALHLLAYMEHTWIPDESYFCAVVANHQKFAYNVVNDKKRYLRFHRQHPVKLTMEDALWFPPEEPVGAEAKYFFVRKVNVSENPDLVDWIRKHHIDQHDTARIWAKEKDKKKKGEQSTQAGGEQSVLKVDNV
ncbi:core-2/I-branching enzyme-domain-containing protein [Powellomyces hirtus]|nr:core-2/I-branching enzyme-domain-containing protein [Powellomyces hirtus]